MDFIQAYQALKAKTPRIGAIRLNNINSDYTYATDQLKNCYLIANAVHNENCLYGRDLYDNVDCVDCDHIKDCTLCYQCLNCKNCYDCNHLQDCENCQTCEVGYDLKGCKDCIGCVGLRKKEYHIFNEPYSKEDFLKKKRELTSAMIEGRFETLKLKIPRQFADLVNVEHASGNCLYHCRNVLGGYDCLECQDCLYIEESKKLKDCMDITILEESELCYEISSSHILYNSNYCFQCASSSDLDFCELVMNSKHCFGCISLNRKAYCVLNQPYSKEEYFKKVAEIKEWMKREKISPDWFFRPPIRLKTPSPAGIEFEYNANMPTHWFLDAYAELQRRTPRLGLLNVNSENCQYTAALYYSA